MSADRNADIAIRAYLIWESKGRPNDKALDHWLQAESEVATPAAPPDTLAPLKPSKPADAKKGKAK